MRDKEILGLWEAYQYVHQPKEQINEEVENWVNSLIEEGYDLSEYTWDDMYEIYMTEGRNTSLSALSAESEKRKADKKRGRPETEAEVHGRLALGDFRPGASQEERARGGRQRLKDRGKVPQKGGKDMFEHVLEYLVAEGYADTNESALVIMANMSEEWRESIVDEVISEGEKPFPYEKVKRKQVALRDKGSAGLERRMRMGTAVRRAKEAEKTGGSQQDAGKGWYHGR